MPKKRFSEEQIAFASRQANAGTAVGEICRKMGVAEATFYRWRKVNAGMGVSEIRRLKQLKDENGKLKRLVADLTLDRPCFRAEKKCMTCPARARILVVLTTAVRLNVSGLSRVGCGCSEAMMRSARIVLR